MRPESLLEANPRLVIVRVSGYGQIGPYSDCQGYGAIGEAMGGLRDVIGEPDRPPARADISIGDTLAATFACVGCLVARHQVERSGKGQVVDSPTPRCATPASSEESVGARQALPIGPRTVGECAPHTAAVGREVRFALDAVAHHPRLTFERLDTVAQTRGEHRVT